RKGIDVGGGNSLRADSQQQLMRVEEGRRGARAQVDPVQGEDRVVCHGKLVGPRNGVDTEGKIGTVSPHPKGIDVRSAIGNESMERTELRTIEYDVATLDPTGSPIDTRCDCR